MFMNYLLFYQISFDKYILEISIRFFTWQKLNFITSVFHLRFNKLFHQPNIKARNICYPMNFMFPINLLPWKNLNIALYCFRNRKLMSKKITKYFRNKFKLIYIQSLKIHLSFYFQYSITIKNCSFRISSI